MPGEDFPPDEETTVQHLKMDPMACVVVGLTSDAGRQLNGALGKVTNSLKDLEAAGPEDRLAVHLLDKDDGRELPAKAIRRQNLEFSRVQRDTTGAGVCVVTCNPLRDLQSLAFARWTTDAGPTKAAIAALQFEHLPFATDDDLPVPLQFLLACGARPDLDRAQEALQRMVDAKCRAVPLALRAQTADGAAGFVDRNEPASTVGATEAAGEDGCECDEEDAEYDETVEYDDDDDDEVIFTPAGPETDPAGSAPAAAPAPAPTMAALVEMQVPECTVLPPALLALRGSSQGLARLRVPGAGLTALEWAAKSGHLDIVRWLCTDGRTQDLLQAGSPLGWACYAGHVEVARFLLSVGADARATDALLWKGLPPLLAAAEGGQVDTLAFLVQEARISIHTTDEQGLGILHKIRHTPGFEQNAKLRAVEAWAEAHGAKKQHIKWK